MNELDYTRILHRIFDIGGNWYNELNRENRDMRIYHWITLNDNLLIELDENKTIYVHHYRDLNEELLDTIISPEKFLTIKTMNDKKQITIEHTICPTCYENAIINMTKGIYIIKCQNIKCNLSFILKSTAESWKNKFHITIPRSDKKIKDFIKPKQ